MAIIRTSLSANDVAVDLSGLMSTWLDKMSITDLFRTCVTCQNLQNDRHCLKFNSPPPASVVVTGCDQYADREEIPF